MKQTETNAKQILFRFVRTEIYFCLFRGQPSQAKASGHGQFLQSLQAVDYSGKHSLGEWWTSLIATAKERFF